MDEDVWEMKCQFCGKPHFANGWCIRCYDREKRLGRRVRIADYKPKKQCRSGLAPKIIAAYERYGSSILVAKRFEVSQTTISRSLTANGVKVESRGRPKKRDERFISFLVSIVLLDVVG